GFGWICCWRRDRHPLGKSSVPLMSRHCRLTPMAVCTRPVQPASGSAAGWPARPLPTEQRIVLRPRPPAPSGGFCIQLAPVFLADALAMVIVLPRILVQRRKPLGQIAHVPLVGTAQL